VGHVAGREIKWPNRPGFVHIDENGNTSPALREWNLPWRRQKLYEMLCTEPKLQEPGSRRSCGMSWQSCSTR
jgi:hypothetical protein